MHTYAADRYVNYSPAIDNAYVQESKTTGTYNKERETQKWKLAEPAWLPWPVSVVGVP
jgi:hypothetical protein